MSVLEEIAELWNLRGSDSIFCLAAPFVGTVVAVIISQLVGMSWIEYGFTANTSLCCRRSKEVDTITAIAIAVM